MLNHSCRPNCVFATSGAPSLAAALAVALAVLRPDTLQMPAAGLVMHVRAVLPIKAGEELTVSYLGSACNMEPRAERQARLLAGKHFRCTCQRCREPLDTCRDRFLEVSTAAALPLMV